MSARLWLERDDIAARDIRAHWVLLARRNASRARELDAPDVAFAALVREFVDYTRLYGPLDPDSQEGRQNRAAMDAAAARGKDVYAVCVASDEHAIAALCPDIALIACLPHGEFLGWQRGVVSRRASLLELSQRASKEIRAFACGICGGWWFGDDSLSWRCQCCGTSAGNAHVLSEFGSPLPGFPHLIDIRPLGNHD